MREITFIKINIDEITILSRLPIHNVNHSNQLLINLLRTYDDPKMTLIETRIIFDAVLKLLQPLKDLRCLPHRFNCLIPFQILNPGTLDAQENDDDDEAELLNQRSIQVSALAASAQQQQNNEPIDDVPLKEIKQFYIRLGKQF
ncbi:unnamed protein product [Rotaria sp. Silwood1]|nr:unnamed protein product [Rotaria sp. Silwood1]CAF1647341.1 unnamed protein product [Rotaria sp. Silwood1]CAF3822030.1 unnamed protein product [Rotaria sp. Silwood1]